MAIEHPTTEQICECEKFCLNPKGENCALKEILDDDQEHVDCDCMECRPWTT